MFSFFLIWVALSWYAFRRIRRWMRSEPYYDMPHPLWFVLTVLALTSAPSFLISWVLYACFT